jgi:hypothetical protein
MTRFLRFNKFGNVRTFIDGITFDSKFEGRYYCELKLRKKSGEIRDFQVKPKYELLPKNGKYRAVTYIADFLVIGKDGAEQIIDCKGMKTEAFKLKQKMMFSILGKDVICVREEGGRYRGK